MKEYRNLFIYLLTFVLAACQQPKQVNVDQYLEYLDKNWYKLTDSRELNGIVYQARFLPNDYRILERFGQEIASEKLQTERQNLSDFQYFQIRLKAQTGNIMEYNMEEYESRDSRQYYYTHEFARDIFLIDGTDTLRCEAHQFISNYGISPWVSVLAAFERSHKKTAEKRIGINDHIFHNGKVILKIPASAISQIPQLTLSKS